MNPRWPCSPPTSASRWSAPELPLATYGGGNVPVSAPPDSRHLAGSRGSISPTRLEERLIAAACHHTREKHVAILSEGVPGPGWRRLAKQYGVKLVHVPISRFSQATVQQLRMFHVLNGQHIRSYAAHFIRKA